MNELLKKLLALLFPGVDGDTEDVDPPVDDPDKSGAGDDTDDDLPEPDLSDDPPASARSRRSDADERLARLEAEVERRGRLAEEARRAPAAPQVDPQFQREEERLRSADITELEKWQIESNRTIRQATAEARQARLEAADTMDRARFESKMNSDPRRSKYADRVEEAIQQERSQGRNASREAVYFYLLGKDIAEGKLKPKAKTTAAPQVPRGKPAGVRSDVQGRGRPTTDRDKLRARLENQAI